MMGWLLKMDGYPPGVLFTLLLHGGLLLFIYSRNLQPDDFIKIDTATYIQAAVIQENPQKLRLIEQNRVQQQELQKQRDRERERQAAARREADQKAAADKAKAEADLKKKADAERIAKADAEKKQQAEADRAKQALAEAQRKKAAEDEAARQRALSAAEDQKRQQDRALQQQNQAAETNLVSQYAAIIRQLIQQNWVIPPNGRNGMLAIVQIRMTPVGDITSADIIQGSGDAVFDRSVLQAIDRVESFPELRELPIAVFERNFRTFTLNFTPEDLLR